MPASASPPPSPPVRTPGQQPSHPASATNRSRTPQNDRFALYSPRNPDRRWIRCKAGILVGLGRGHEDDVLVVDLVERLDCVDVEAGQQCGVPPVIFSLTTSTPTPLYVRAGMGDWPPTPSTPPRTSRPSPPRSAVRHGATREGGGGVASAPGPGRRGGTGLHVRGAVGPARLGAHPVPLAARSPSAGDAEERLATADK